MNYLPILPILLVIAGLCLSLWDAVRPSHPKLPLAVFLVGLGFLLAFWGRAGL